MAVAAISPPLALGPSAIPYSMSFLRHRRPSFPNLRRLSTVSASVRQDTTLWMAAPLSLVAPSAESLFHVPVSVSAFPDLATSHSRPGQYLQLCWSDSTKPAFLAIASAPSVAAFCGEFEFLVKAVDGSAADALCRLRKGDVVELSSVMGKGFDVDAISPPESYPTVLIFTTGSGISPIRSLVESGFDAEKR